MARKFFLTSVLFMSFFSSVNLHASLEEWFDALDGGLQAVVGSVNGTTNAINDAARQYDPYVSEAADSLSVIGDGVNNFLPQAESLASSGEDLVSALEEFVPIGQSAADSLAGLQGTGQNLEDLINNPLLLIAGVAIAAGTWKVVTGTMEIFVFNPAKKAFWYRCCAKRKSCKDRSKVYSLRDEKRKPSDSDDNV